jgi:hypothetical protein
MPDNVKYTIIEPFFDLLVKKYLPSKGHIGITSLKEKNFFSWKNSDNPLQT